jgi:high-affinity nickel permease
MSLYDLRYTKAPSKKQLKSKIATDPYRVFPWENTSFDFGFGFDYNAELGIIATASSKSKCRQVLPKVNLRCLTLKLFLIPVPILITC